MRAVNRKVLRDLARMRGQMLAIALVIASGVGLFLGMRTVMRSLESARSSYYANQRFAHVFASLKRAPEHVAERLLEIPGVERVQTRVVADVILDVPKPNGEMIVPLTLQMLFENAVKHNEISKGCPLHIKIYSKDDFLVVENKIHPRSTPVEGTGNGLINLDKRYFLLRKKKIVISQEDDTFKVQLPLISGA